MTIDRTLAHRTLTTKHETMSYEGRDGRITCRKHAGRYIVRVERYDPSNSTYMDFATLNGAMIAFDGAKELV